MSAAGFMSPPRAPFKVLPVFRDSSIANSSRCLVMRSPIRQRSFERSDAFIFGQGPLSKARRAALTARSTSSARPRSTVVSISPVAGFMTSIVLPETHPSDLLSIQSRPGLMACCMELASISDSPSQPVYPLRPSAAIITDDAWAVPSRIHGDEVYQRRQVRCLQESRSTLTFRDYPVLLDKGS